MTGLRALGLAAALAALLLPAGAPAYLVTFSLQLFMYVVLAGSWNIVSGFTGYTSFGHVAFFGIGAYTAAILITRLGMAWPLAALAGGAMALVLGLPVGAICLRLKGPYFAIAMLGFAESLRLLATLWTSLTKGGTGITLPPIQTLVPTYYAMLACVAAVVGVNYRIATSSFGLRLLSIREDERGAEAIGINTTTHKIAAFALSTIFPGIVGGLYAQYISYVDPSSIFLTLITVQTIIMTILGGAGTVLGPVLGATTISVVQEVLWARFPHIHQGLLGVLIIGVILFLPGGVVEVLKEWRLLPRVRSI
ncbi:MAG TPA: branched-chain amino acid ABC transporter permease [Candidatus Sulfotelmatobacter sp.]|nr:branched-chain amino acid ABC transporter permease [Candidatus Sulfotelmatobacter sp.]